MDTLNVMAKANSEVLLHSESESGLEPTSPRRASNSISCCLGGCQGEEKHELDQNTIVEKSRGIKKGSKSRRRRGVNNDAPCVTFDQFFEVMSASMTRGMGEDGESDGSILLRQQENGVKGSNI